MSIIAITGMHRSGTSLTSNWLQIAGLHLGSNLIQGSKSNPGGHFEDIDFAAFHEKILFENETNYLTLKEKFVISNSLRKEGVELLRSKSKQFTWGWKDPRTALFLELWFEIDPEINYILLFRDPMEVAISLYNREKAFSRKLRYSPIHKLLFLMRATRVWYNYNSKIEAFFSKNKKHCILIETRDILQKGPQLIALANQKFAANFQEKEIDSIILPNRFHQSNWFYSLFSLTNIKARHLYKRLKVIKSLS